MSDEASNRPRLWLEFGCEEPASGTWQQQAPVEVGGWLQEQATSFGPNGAPGLYTTP